MIFALTTLLTPFFLNILETKRIITFKNGAKWAYEPIFWYFIKNSNLPKMSLTTLLHSAVEIVLGNIKILYHFAFKFRSCKTSISYSTQHWQTPREHLKLLCKFHTSKYTLTLHKIHLLTKDPDFVLLDHFIFSRTFLNPQTSLGCNIS